MTFLLDTCVISEVIKPRPTESVVQWLSSQDEIGLYLSVITIGEIRKGIERLGEGEKKRDLSRWVDQDLSLRFSGRIIDIDRQVAERWGSISARADLGGKRLPVVDGLIAATALEHGLTLVTRNTDDMEASGVALFDPWQAD